MMSESQIHLQLPSIKEEQTFRSNDPLKILTWLRMKLNNLINSIFWATCFCICLHRFSQVYKRREKWNKVQFYPKKQVCAQRILRTLLNLKKIN